MAYLEEKLSVGGRIEFKEVIHMLNVEIERFTPPMKGITHTEFPKSGTDTHIFFGKRKYQLRKELDPIGELDDYIC